MISKRQTRHVIIYDTIQNSDRSGSYCCRCCRSIRFQMDGAMLILCSHSVTTVEFVPLIGTQRQNTLRPYSSKPLSLSFLSARTASNLLECTAQNVRADSQHLIELHRICLQSTQTSCSALGALCSLTLVDVTVWGWTFAIVCHCTFDIML